VDLVFYREVFLNLNPKIQKQVWAFYPCVKH
jgi:hypothetical protein